MKKILIFSIFLSCGAGVSDYAVTINENYYYSSNSDRIYSNSGKNRGIEGKVLKYDFNKDFVIAYQKPSFIWYEEGIARNISSNNKKYRYNTSEDIEETKKLADSIIKNDPYYIKIFSREYNFWIIDLKTDSLYGPYSEKEFLKERKKLKIPENLSFK